MSADRLNKLRLQMSHLVSMKRVPILEFRKLVFRMNWASTCFPMSRVFLHKFFAVLKSSPAKSGYVFTLTHLQPIFDLWFSMIEAAEQWESAVLAGKCKKSDALTRTDAMADSSAIFLGGWRAESISAFRAGQLSWFAYELDTAFFPDVKQTANRMISAAEAIGVAIAIAGFASWDLGSDSNVTVLSASGKWYSPSANFAAAMTCIVKASAAHGVRPVLTHVPGKDNALADALSRMKRDKVAAQELSWLPAGARLDGKAVLTILPELAGFLTPIRVA
jgi:hypothetical protein